MSKVRQLLDTKVLYTKFTVATQNFKRTKAVARFKNENCMDLAFDDRLAKQENGVKYSLDAEVVNGEKNFKTTVKKRGKPNIGKPVAWW